MIDPFGRHISYLRVSVTDRCDFRCVYCMAEDMTFLPKAEVLSLEELERLCSAFVRRGVKKLRLTGGEPLVRKNVMSLIRGLGRHLDSGALDELTRLEMNDLLLRIRHETKASVLFVTHSISEAVYLSDKVIVFSKRPARVAQEIPIPLAYPRSQRVRFTAAFTTAERTASEALGVIAPAPEEVPAP